jgi:predicted nucleotidyltransferase
MHEYKNIRDRYPFMFTKKDDSIRYEHAWEKAKNAAKILKEDYAAKRVFVYGSLLKKELFDDSSDIDLAVEGIPEARFYKAVGEITKVIDTYNIDIVDYENCKSFLSDAIKKEGIEI